MHAQCNPLTKGTPFPDTTSNDEFGKRLKAVVPAAELSSAMSVLWFLIDLRTRLSQISAKVLKATVITRR